MGAHTTPEERYELVTRYHRSGLTQREFCEAEGITVGVLRSWLHKGNWKPVDGPRFVEVTSPRRDAETDTIELRLGDVRVVLPLSISNERIVELVVALERRVEASR
jgi:hypothetical protein